MLAVDRHVGYEPKLRCDCLMERFDAGGHRRRAVDGGASEVKFLRLLKLMGPMNLLVDPSLGRMEET